MKVSNALFGFVMVGNSVVDVLKVNAMKWFEQVEPEDGGGDRLSLIVYIADLPVDLEHVRHRAMRLHQLRPWRGSIGLPTDAALPPIIADAMRSRDRNERALGTRADEVMRAAGGKAGV